MSHPFNFLQGDSGVAPYPSGFSGVFTPTGMLETPWFYQWRADHEVYEQKPSLEIGFSGSQEAGVSFDSNTQEFVFSGALMGLKSGAADFLASFSGQQLKANLDSGNFQINFSGRLSGVPQETNNIDLIITGLQKAYPINLSEMDCVLSGSKPFSATEQGDFISRISGNIIKSDKDLVSFSVTFSGVEWNSYRPRIKTPIGPDTVSMGISIVRIVWSRAGG